MSIVLKMKQMVRDSFAFQRTSDAPYHAVMIHGMLCFLLLCLLGLAGCPQPTTDFSQPPVEAKDGRPAAAFVFIVDGVNGKIFNDLLAAGKLPNFQKYFVEQGAYTPGAIANVPSVTLANLTSIVTGKYPAHHGVLANNWFDRKSLIFRNYAILEEKNTLDADCKAKQIYGYFPEDFTVSIFLQPHKGASKFFENALSAGPAWGFGLYELLDDITMYRFPEMMWLARGEGKFPKIVCTYLLAPDFMAYTQGLGEAYRQSIIRVDGQIGKFMDDLKTADLLDKVVVAVVSDHSHDDVKQHFRLKDYLKKQGYKVASSPIPSPMSPEQRKAYFDKYDLVLNVCGEQYAAITLRGKDKKGEFLPWDKPVDLKTKKELLEKLGQFPAVDVTACCGEAGILECRGQQTIMRISRKPNGKIYWEAIELKEGCPFMGGGDATAQEWLERTDTGQYPNLPVHLMNYFDSEKAGDIVVFAAPGWDFNGNHKGGHGGVRGDEDLRVPMLLRGPGVPCGKKIPIAQTVDLLPTLLTLMGKPLPDDLDGEPLFVTP